MHRNIKAILTQTNSNGKIRNGFKATKIYDKANYCNVNGNLTTTLSRLEANYSFEAICIKSKPRIANRPLVLVVKLTLKS